MKNNNFRIRNISEVEFRFAKSTNFFKLLRKKISFIFHISFLCCNHYISVVTQKKIFASVTKEIHPYNIYLYSFYAVMTVIARRSVDKMKNLSSTPHTAKI